MFYELMVYDYPVTTFATLSRKVCKLKSLGLDFIILAFLQK